MRAARRRGRWVLPRAVALSPWPALAWKPGVWLSLCELGPPVTVALSVVAGGLSLKSVPLSVLLLVSRLRWIGVPRGSRRNTRSLVRVNGNGHATS